MPQLTKKSIIMAEKLETSFNRLTRSKNYKNKIIETDRAYNPKINENRLDFKKDLNSSRL